MLRSLVSFSLRFRGVMVGLSCLVLAYGVYITLHSKYDVYPEFAPPRVEVQTEAPGLSPEQVEALVTRAIENALNGAPGLDTMRSQSIQGLSVITLIFADRVDVYRARQMVSERLSQAAARLPLGVEPPGLAPLTGSTSLMLIVGLTSPAQPDGTENIRGLGPAPTSARCPRSCARDSLRRRHTANSNPGPT